MPARMSRTILGLLVALGRPAAAASESFDAAPAQPLPAPWSWQDGSLRCAPDGEATGLVLPLADESPHLVLAVQLEFAAGQPWAGLLYRAADALNGQVAVVSADGGWRIGYLADGHLVTALTGRAAELTWPATLELRVEGELQTLSLNGERVATRRDRLRRRGAVGLVAGGSGEVRFDNFAATPLAAVPEAPVALPPDGPLGPQPPAPAGELFREDFDPPRHEWRRDDTQVVAAGELRLRTGPGYKLTGVPAEWRDYAFLARARPLSVGGTYGLVVRLQPDGASGYLFVVRNPDLYAVARLDDGVPALLDRGTCALGNVWNQLSVDCTGDRLRFRVNGTTVTELADDAYAAGGIGLWVDESREAAFDDLLVVRLGEAPTSLGPPPPGAVVRETFDPPILPWVLDAYRQIRDGALFVGSPAGQFVVAGVSDIGFSDYDVEVTARRLDGPETGRHGLLVRLQPDGVRGYLFAVTGRGQYLVWRRDATGVTELARGESERDPPDDRLTARCRGDQLLFALGERVLCTVTDGAYRRGGVGVYVDHGVQARFDDLLATERGEP